MLRSGQSSSVLYGRGKIAALCMLPSKFSKGEESMCIAQIVPAQKSRCLTLHRDGPFRGSPGGVARAASPG